MKTNSKLDVVQLCKTQMFMFVLSEAANTNSFSAPRKTMKPKEKLREKKRKKKLTIKTMRNNEKR